MLNNIVCFILFILFNYSALGHNVIPGINGLFPAVFTPFNEDGQINMDVIPTYAEHLKKNKIDGVLIAGTSGEGPALSMREKKDLLDAWLDSAKPRGLKVVMQVGGSSFPEVLELAQFAEDSEADAIMTLPELYFKAKSEDGVVEYLKKVSSAAPSLPIIYYHHPSYTGVNLNIAKFFTLATLRIPTFKGVKCSLQCALEITAYTDLKKDQTIFINSPLTMASNFLMGFNSSMAAGISIFPKLILDIERAVKENDVGKARELQMTLNKRFGTITSEGDYIPTHKAAMEMVTGVRVGNPRCPVSRLTRKQRKKIFENLAEMGVNGVTDIDD